jgi:hypothetical protein
MFTEKMCIWRTKLLDFTAVYNLTILTEELSVASVTAKLKEPKKISRKWNLMNYHKYQCNEINFNEQNVQ